MPRIQLDHITKIYHVSGNKRKKQLPQDVYALDDVNITIEDGEFAVVIGSSGCGKSTLLRVIAGLEEQTEGSVWLKDQIVDSLPPGKREIALVFQEYALYPNRTAFENMAFPLMNQGVKHEEIKKIIEEIAEALEISYLLNRIPKQMSWGQRQRVALGRALSARPSILLMDEPLSGADEVLRRSLQQKIKELHRKYKLTCIYVTHDLREAEMIADRILVMDMGRITSELGMR